MLSSTLLVGPLGCGWRADGGTGAATVDLTVGYGSFSHAFGGDFGSRLQAFLAPACALTTPEVPECAVRTPLAGGNDPKAQTVSARVQLPAVATDVEAQSTESGPGGLTSADGAEASSGEQVVLLAATAASDKGTFAKTSLASAMSWQAGTSAGGFTTSYQVSVPPVPGDLVPQVSFGYSSSAVDGRTNAESAQTSWLGEGWSYEPGYIERIYRPCAQDTDTTPTYSTPTSGDLCWNVANANLVWGGKSTPLVLDSASGLWKLADGDGSVVSKYTGPGNYGQDAEVWKITTADGTQYHFGLNKRPGWVSGAPETYSAWNVPVFANHSSDRCYQSGGFGGSYCVMTWRWNLDYVVSPAGNSMTYFYNKETPKTGRNGSATNLISYDRGGYVDHIEYGTRAGQEFTAGVKPVGRVEFTLGDRCLSSCWSGSTPVAANWPDVPWDLDCPPSASSCTGNVTPSFWTYRRLAKVTTKVWDHTLATPAYVPVDEWSLAHVFPATGESATDPALWLNDIVHTGLTAGSLALPAVHFGGNRWGNRAGFEAVNTGVNINRFRITDVTNELGGQVRVAYEVSDCGSGTSTPDPDNNTRRCFPQQYTVPGGSSSGWTWWNKLRATQVIERDLVGGQPDVVHDYYYWVQGSSTAVLWRHDTNRFGARLADRSWSDFRGWPTVITTTGTATSGIVNKRKQVFFRGMNGDRTDAGWGTRTGVTTINSRGEAWVDNDYRNGFLFEDLLLNPVTGDVESAKVHYPTVWSTGSRTITGAEPPTQSSTVVEEYVTLTQERVSGSGTASMRYHRVDQAWDQTHDRISQMVDHGLVTVDTSWFGTDGAEADETCTRIDFASTSAAWMTDRVSQSSTYSNVDCSGAAATSVIKQAQFYYDQQPLGQLPTTAAAVRGLQTKSEELARWTSGTPEYETVATTAYDVHGRVTDITDGLGRVTHTVYTPVSDKAVTSVAVTNAKNFATSTGLDLRRGVPLIVTDPNGKITTGQYDALGRVTKVWQPGHSVSGTADVEYGYNVMGSAGPSYVRSKVLGPNGNQITSYELFDGLGRIRQTQSPAGVGMTMATTNYDARGLATSTSMFQYTGTWAAGTIYAASSPQVEHRYTYDGLGRQTIDDLWSAGVKKWTVATTTYQGDRTIVDQADGGTDTTTHTDVFGRTTMLWQHQNTTTYDTTRYQYDRLGQLTKTIGPDNAEWTHSYDLRGRKTTSVDPDTGTSTTEYDAVGNIIKTVDGRGQALIYQYDELGRKTKEYAGSVDDANQRAEWVYDTVAKGQLYATFRTPAGEPGANYYAGYGRLLNLDSLEVYDRHGLYGTYTRGGKFVLAR